MSKHTQRTLPFDTRTDPDTGAKVTRLTPRAVTCHRNYFYQKCFTNDGKRVIFGGEFGPDVGHPAKPNWNYHLLDLETATALQLTEGAGENTFGGFLSPDDRYLYFVRAERNLVRLHLDTLAEDIVYTKRRINQLYAKHCGRTYEEVENTLDRDHFMTADEAKAWGVVDNVTAERAESAA